MQFWAVLKLVETGEELVGIDPVAFENDEQQVADMLGTTATGFRRSRRWYGITNRYSRGSPEELNGAG